jgi:hypothetical protein
VVAAIVVLAAGCGTQKPAAALVLQVGPPDDAATVAAAAEVVRARLSGLGVDGTVAIDGSRLDLDIPPAEAGSTLAADLVDPARLRLVAVPDGVDPAAVEAVDPSWETVVEAPGPVPAVVEADQTGNPSIVFTFSGTDAERIASYTTAHVGGSLAVAIGDEVLAVPVIQSPITGGSLQLTLANDSTRWTPDRLREVTTVVSAGPLPAPLRLVTGD